MDFIIRKALVDDLELLSKLFDEYRVFYMQKSDLEAARAFLYERIQQNESIIFVAEYLSSIIGFTQLYPVFSSVSLQRSLILNDLYVPLNHRRKGIATSLLEHSKEYARSIAVKGLALETAKNNPAQKLYERLGWINDEEFYHYFWKA